MALSSKNPARRSASTQSSQLPLNLAFTRGYLAFDLEIAKILPDGITDILQYRPLGISCAATLVTGGEPAVWHGLGESGAISDVMSREDVRKFVLYLLEMVKSGYTILTWNGLGFDFDVLAEESGMYEECRDLALNHHVDMMFHFVCLKGYPVSLSKAAEGMNLAGKHMGLSGSEIPKLWADGKRQEVLGYVAQDVRMTLALAEAVEKRRLFRWFSNAGRLMEQAIPKWLPACEALELPLPDTSWMKDPLPRGRFAAWTGWKPR